eukprot:s42_g17.t1
MRYKRAASESAVLELLENDWFTANFANSSGPGMDSLVEACFIHFHIFPCLGAPAVTVLNLGDVEIADEVEIPVHPFHRLVVNVGNQMDDVRNCCKTKKKSGI